MLVRNFMVSDVVTLSPDQTCHAALQELQRCKVRRAPVVQNNKLVGIVSERDLLRVLPGTCAQACGPPSRPAAKIVPTTQRTQSVGFAILASWFMVFRPR